MIETLSFSGPNGLLAIIIAGLLALLISLHYKQKKKTTDATIQIDDDTARIQSFCTYTQDAIIRTDANEAIIDWTGQAEQLFGWRKEEVLGKKIPDVIVPLNTRDIYRDELYDFFTSHPVPTHKRLTLTAQHRDGSPVPIEASITLLELQNTHEFCIFIRDLTAHAKAQLKIKEQQQSLATQKEALDEHAIVSITNANGDITYANHKFEAISQYSRDELIGSNHRILNSGHHSADFFIDMWQTISSGNIWHGTIQNKAKDNSLYWVKSTIAPILNEQGKIVQYIAIRTDITPIKQLEEELQTVNNKLSEHIVKVEQEKSYFELLFEKSGYGTAMVRDNVFVDFNEKLAEMVGYQSAYEIPNHILEFSPEYQPDGQSSKSKATEVLRIAANEGSCRSEWLQRKTDGSTFWCDILITRLNNESPPLFHIVWRDISVEKQLGEDNQRITNEAIKANKAKSEFLSSMSHELRTPMNSILGFAQLLKADEDDPLSANQHESIDFILSSGKHLLSLINDVLELAAIESGKLVLSLEPVGIANMAQEIVTLLLPLAKEADVTINITSDNDDYIVADYTKLKQVIINLVSNAIKYNKKGGSVTIDWQANCSQQLHFTVSDTGLGISQQNKRHVFGAFNRLGQENSGIEGTGIGLVVTKNLVEIMQGKIGFDSTEGIGSNFWFEFPISVDLENLENLENLDQPDSPSTSGDSKTVLYIEDNIVNQLYMEGVFDLHEEYSLTMVESAELGWDYAMHQPVDLILMDINLPGMSGKELTKRLRETDLYKNRPIIAFSASAMKHDIESAEGLFDMYLTKPIKMDELINAVKKHI